MSSSLTSRLGLIKPTPGTAEAVNVATHINQSYDILDDVAGAKPCTSGTRPPTPFDGQLIRETDTKRLMMWNANQSTWDQVNEAPVLQDGATGTIATPGTTEAVVRTLASKVYKNGKAYDIEIRCQITPSSTNGINFRLRKGTTTAGALILDYGRFQLSQIADTYCLLRGSFENNTGADITTQLVICGIASTGTVTVKGTTTGPFEVRITELPGSAADYTALATIS